MSVPFVVEIPDVADGDVDAFVFSAFDKDRKAVMVSAYVDELPVIIPAHCFQVVDVLSLERFVIFAGITAGGKLIVQIFFKFC